MKNLIVTAKILKMPWVTKQELEAASEVETQVNKLTNSIYPDYSESIAR